MGKVRVHRYYYAGWSHEAVDVGVVTRVIANPCDLCLFRCSLPTFSPMGAVHVFRHHVAFWSDASTRKRPLSISPSLSFSLSSSLGHWRWAICQFFLSCFCPGDVCGGWLLPSLSTFLCVCVSDVMFGHTPWWLMWSCVFRIVQLPSPRNICISCVSVLCNCMNVDNLYLCFKLPQDFLW